MRQMASSRNTSTSQGQTFEKIGILLRQSVFIPGQLYVAVSRVRSLDGLRFYTSEYNGQGHLANNERVNKKKHRLYRSFESLNSFSNYLKFNRQHLYEARIFYFIFGINFLFKFYILNLKKIGKLTV
jgi:hypothetical protein